MNNLISNEKLEALAKLSEGLRKLGKNKHADNFTFQVYAATMTDYWEWYKERNATVEFLQDIIGKSIDNGRTEIVKGLIQVQSQMDLSETMYFKVITCDALLLEKENKINEKEQEKMEMSKEIIGLQKEVEKLVKVIENEI